MEAEVWAIRSTNELDKYSINERRQQDGSWFTEVENLFRTRTPTKGHCRNLP